MDLPDSDASAVRPPVICLMGPTASGKTELAMHLYDRFPCELVSVDSVLVYRGMDIGAAKPDAQTLQRYPHHLIDILDPAEAYSAARFRDDALALMRDITARGKVPLLVGGTMLYFKALTDGLATMPSADPVIRARIERMALEGGWETVHAALAEVDPESIEDGQTGFGHVGELLPINRSTSRQPAHGRGDARHQPAGCSYLHGFRTRLLDFH